MTWANININPYALDLDGDLEEKLGFV